MSSRTIDIGGRSAVKSPVSPTGASVGSLLDIRNATISGTFRRSENRLTGDALKAEAAKAVADYVKNRDSVLSKISRPSLADILNGADVERSLKGPGGYI